MKVIEKKTQLTLDREYFWDTQCDNRTPTVFCKRYQVNLVKLVTYSLNRMGFTRTVWYNRKGDTEGKDKEHNSSKVPTGTYLVHVKKW